MTQAQVDAAVRGHIADPANHYDDLRKQVRTGNPRAAEQARLVFGPTALHKKIQCRCKTLIIKSPAYQEAREQLGFGKKAARAKASRTAGVGASDKHAKGPESDPSWMLKEDVESRLCQLKPAQANALRADLQTRTLTPAQVAEILDAIEGK
jgi:hypothetical protein